MNPFSPILVRTSLVNFYSLKSSMILGMRWVCENCRAFSMIWMAEHIPWFPLRRGGTWSWVRRCNRTFWTWRPDSGGGNKEASAVWEQLALIILQLCRLNCISGIAPSSLAQLIVSVSITMGSTGAYRELVFSLSSYPSFKFILNLLTKLISTSLDSIRAKCWPRQVLAPMLKGVKM